MTSLDRCLSKTHPYLHFIYILLINKLITIISRISPQNVSNDYHDQIDSYTIHRDTERKKISTIDDNNSSNKKKILSFLMHTCRIYQRRCT